MRNLCHAMASHRHIEGKRPRDFHPAYNTSAKPTVNLPLRILCHYVVFRQLPPLLAVIACHPVLLHVRTGQLVAENERPNIDQSQRSCALNKKVWGEISGVHFIRTHLNDDDLLWDWLGNILPGWFLVLFPLFPEFRLWSHRSDTQGSLPVLGTPTRFPALLSGNLTDLSRTPTVQDFAVECNTFADPTTGPG